MRLVLAALLLAAPFAAVATEQSLPEPEPQGLVDIPVEEWSDMALGRTLNYTIDGKVWALEHYEPGSNRVTLRFYDGNCLEGVWEFTAPLYCFHWKGVGTSCFRHVRLNGEILVLETRDGVETGAAQIMKGVSDVPVSCGMPPTS